jgi:polyhydroxyalkanoate synthesis regulator phasin
MTPKSAKRFLDQVMHQKRSMTPKSAKRFLDQVMRQKKSMTFELISERLTLQTRAA